MIRDVTPRALMIRDVTSRAMEIREVISRDLVIRNVTSRALLIRDVTCPGVTCLEVFSVSHSQVFQEVLLHRIRYDATRSLKWKLEMFHISCSKGLKLRDTV